MHDSTTAGEEDTRSQEMQSLETPSSLVDDRSNLQHRSDQAADAAAEARLS